MERRLGFRRGRGLQASRGGSALGLAVLLLLLLASSSDGFRMPSFRVLRANDKPSSTASAYGCVDRSNDSMMGGGSSKTIDQPGRRDFGLNPLDNCRPKEAPVRTALYSEAEGSSTGPAKVVTAGPLNVTVVRM
jgi:hypothetical protein